MELVRSLALVSLVALGLPVRAGLSIAEIDPYKVIEDDKAKEQGIYEPKTRDQASILRQEKIKKIQDQELPPFCDTAKEFQLTHQELIHNNLVELPERETVRISYEVTKGCTGAAERFKKILSLLLKSGVDKKKSLEIAIHFAHRTDSQTMAFQLVFTGTFLEKYFDLDFKTALTTSLELALNARGTPGVVAKDFRTILDFCLLNKDVGLPFKTCAPYSLELSKQSYLFSATGLSDSFTHLMDFFQGQKESDFNLATRLKFAGKILRHGPKAVENFENQYQYSISENMHLPQKTAVQLAVKVAENTIGKELL